MIFLHHHLFIGIRSERIHATDFFFFLWQNNVFFCAPLLFRLLLIGKGKCVTQRSKVVNNERFIEHLNVSDSVEIDLLSVKDQQ